MICNSLKTLLCICSDGLKSVKEGYKRDLLLGMQSSVFNLLFNLVPSNYTLNFVTSSLSAHPNVEDKNVDRDTCVEWYNSILRSFEERVSYPTILVKNQSLDDDFNKKLI